MRSGSIRTCFWHGCAAVADSLCGICDGHFCAAHSDHGPIGDAGHGESDAAYRARTKTAPGDPQTVQCPPTEQAVLDAIAQARVVASGSTGKRAGEYRRLAAWLRELLDGRTTIAGLREQLRNEREAGLSAYEACGLRGAYWHVVEMLGRRDEELAETQEALAHASRLVVKGAQKQAALQTLVERIENEAHDGGIVSETMAEVHRLATGEPILGRSEIARVLDGESIDEVIPYPFDVRLELRVLGDLAYQLLSTPHGRRYDPAVTRTLERLIALDLRVRATPPAPIVESKARAFDRVRDALAEFGNMPDHIGGILSEIIGAWEQEHPGDATLGQLIDGLAFHGCVTGDCPDEHAATECNKALVVAIREFAEQAATLLRVAPVPTPRLRYAYNAACDVLTIEGVNYAGGVFRTLAWPNVDRWYRFERQNADVIVREVAPTDLSDVLTQAGLALEECIRAFDVRYDANIGAEVSVLAKQAHARILTVVPQPHERGPHPERTEQGNSSYAQSRAEATGLGDAPALGVPSKAIECRVCRHRLSDAECEGLSACPQCHTREPRPMDHREDVTVTINPQQLRILTVWASNWLQQHRDAIAPSIHQAFGNLLDDIRAQHPAIPLTLGDEVKQLHDAGLAASLHDDQGNVLIEAPKKQ